MRRRSIGCLVAAALGLAALVPALSAADSVATTGSATSISNTTADLHGVVSPAYADTAWYFQYGTSPTLTTGAAITHPVATDTTEVPEAVEAQISALTPSTVYYFRLIVEAEPNTSAPLVDDYGDIHTFTTTGAAPSGVTRYGKAALTSRTLKVSGKVARIVMRCSGSAGAICNGATTLTATGAHGAKVACGGGEFVATAPHTHTVRARPSAACRKLIGAAKGKRLAATFTALFSTHQSKLTARVTLVG